MNISEDFERLFELLTGNSPFPWQETLFEELIEKKFRKLCDIPTGLGKTSIMAIWLLALAHHSQARTLTGFPRRLVYVVNRRTVVDQATREARYLRDALAKAELAEVVDQLRGLCVQDGSVPLAISTLRGQFADNQEWRNDPARPAVIVGTVDMIGSRLLFAGYGCGFKSKPLHAGFLGQDVLLVHDEAHLESAFQKLISAIETEQSLCREFKRFLVMELSATSRSNNKDEKPLFSEADQKHPVVRIRLGAKKALAFYSVDNEKNIAEKVVEQALEYKNTDQTILVFLRRLTDVEKVSQQLLRGGQLVQVLTGTLRGLERDALDKTDRIFARFMPKPETKPASGTVYLVCTSAGEVGVDISADHMICDLTPFDSMAQRFGRVNRYGKGDARIDVIYAVNPKKDETGDISRFDNACERTFSLLQTLPMDKDGLRDASPAALA